MLDDVTVEPAVLDAEPVIDIPVSEGVSNAQALVPAQPSDDVLSRIAGELPDFDAIDGDESDGDSGFDDAISLSAGDALLKGNRGKSAAIAEPGAEPDANITAAKAAPKVAAKPADKTANAPEPAQEIARLSQELATVKANSVPLAEGESVEIGQTYLALGRLSMSGKPKEFWETAHKESEPRTESLAASILLEWAPWSYEVLRVNGKLPQPTDAQGKVIETPEGNADVDPLDLEIIPADFHATFKRLTAVVQNSLLEMPEKDRIATLAILSNGVQSTDWQQKHDAKETEEKALQERQRVIDGTASFRKEVRAIIAEKVKAELKMTGDEKLDARFNEMIVSTIQVRLEDTQDELWVDSFALVTNKDNHGLKKHKLVCTAAGSQVLDELVKELTGHFEQYRAMAAQLRAKTAPRKEVKGAGVAAGNQTPTQAGGSKTPEDVLRSITANLEETFGR